LRGWADDLAGQLRPVPPVQGWRPIGAPERANAVYEDPAREFWPAAEKAVEAVRSSERLTQKWLAGKLMMNVRTLQRIITDELKMPWPEVKKRLTASRSR
jgi:hypothetical protein